MYSIAYLLIPNLFSSIAHAAPQFGNDEKGPILNCGRGDIPLTTFCTDNAYTCDITTFDLEPIAEPIDQCSACQCGDRPPHRNGPSQPPPANEAPPPPANEAPPPSPDLSGPAEQKERSILNCQDSIPLTDRCANDGITCEAGGLVYGSGTTEYAACISASEDPNNTADQSQAGGEPAAAGVAPAEEISGFGAPKPEDPSAPAEENAKGPD
ncbi:MAG: hypothetical protein LQ337_008471, partial [Flavoplaca oasis]